MIDFMSVGLNAAVIAAIIGLTKVLTTVFDKDGKLSRWYIVVPSVLAIAAAFCMTTPLQWQGVALNALLYAGASTYFYKFGKTVITGE